MAYERVRPAKIAEVIAQQIETLILEGVLEPGEKLPPERELAQQLDVSRPSLRDAIRKLERTGVLERQGGGAYVRDILGPVITGPLLALFRDHPEMAADFVEFRKAMEGVIAYLAALRGTDSDREVIARRFEAMEWAHQEADPQREAEADADFHLAIAEAAHNPVMLHIMRSLFDLLRQGVLFNRRQLSMRRGGRELLLKQHRALYEAVTAGDPEGARQAALTHLSYVQEAMREMEQEAAREAMARRRLDRLKRD